MSTHSVSACNERVCFSAPRIFSNGANVSLGEFGPGVRGPARLVAAALSLAVCRIISVGSFEEVRWIATWRVVAFVQRASRPALKCQKERNAMGKNQRSINIDSPIALANTRACPRPTRIRPAGSVHLGPESLCKWTLIHTHARAETKRIFGMSALMALERRAADFAGKLKGHVDLLSRVPRRGLCQQVPGLFVPAPILPKTAQPRHFWGSEVVACL